MKRAEKKEARKLLKTLSNKEVAKMLNVTEKTVGLWNKEFKEEKVTIKHLKIKIETLAKDISDLKEIMLRHTNNAI